MTKTILFWRRIDVEGFERLEIETGSDTISVAGTVLCADAGGFRLDHRWTLSPDWRALSVSVEQWNAAGRRSLLLERDGTRWKVDGRRRPDLGGAGEPDLSVTPFCNTLPIRCTPQQPGASLALDTAYVDGAAMTVVRSSQRYDRQGPGRLRYVDLGTAKGFEADLRVDAQGLVVSYEHLFERVSPA
jgi:hypothetical protein